MTKRSIRQIGKIFGIGYDEMNWKFWLDKEVSEAILCRCKERRQVVSDGTGTGFKCMACGKKIQCKYCVRVAMYCISGKWVTILYCNRHERKALNTAIHALAINSSPMFFN